MRDQERKLLETPLPSGTDADGAERELRRVLGVHSDSLERLSQGLLSQLGPTPSELSNLPLDEQRRVLIADHAYASTRQVAEHLVHAVYDYWEALDHWERCDKKYSRLQSADGRINFPHLQMWARSCTKT
jgi:hypothetical protein